MGPAEIIEQFGDKINEMREAGNSWENVALTLTKLVNVNVSPASLKVTWSRKRQPVKVEKASLTSGIDKGVTSVNKPKNIDQELKLALNAATQKINELKDEIDTLKKYNNELQINNKELQESNSELNHKLDDAIIENSNVKELLKSIMSQSEIQVNVYKRVIGELREEIDMLKKNIENNI
jgi:chromosome segregation ATPase